jgi:GT2 family glycosyltransferase
LHRTLLFRWTALFRRADRQYRRKSFNPDALRRVAVLMGAAVLLPRRVFDELGGWNEGYDFGGEDIELSHRVNRKKQVVYLPMVEITHYGRASSRLNIRFTEPNVEIGYARFLRELGTQRGVLAFYKLVVICDVPVQIVAKTLQLGWRKLRGQQDKAAKSALALRGFRSFLSGGVGRFWRA